VKLIIHHYLTTLRILIGSRYLNRGSKTANINIKNYIYLQLITAK